VIAESCAVVVPVSPRMQLLKAMPATAMLCDAIPVVLTVRNTGDTILRGIRIQDTLPEGMTTLEGHPAVLFEAGAVEPGQSREFRFNARVERTGTFTNRAVAVCDEGLRVDAAARVTVGQPILTLEKRGPDRVFIGRRAAYDITVANRGDATAYGLTVRDELPAGVEVTEVSRGGQIQGNAVVWAFEQLPPNGAARVSVALRTSLPMELRNRATAVARCAEPVSAGAVTEFAGVPALLLEVIDVDDPIEVGSAEIYEVTVTNQGTMTATNVRIACTLEDNMAFVSATGPTGPTPEGQTVSFAPLPTLAPKERVTWRIHVNAIKEGDVRFQVEMICDQLTRMVRETEATNVY